MIALPNRIRQATRKLAPKRPYDKPAPPTLHHQANGWVLGQIDGDDVLIDDVVISADELAVRLSELSIEERLRVVPIPIFTKIPLLQAIEYVQAGLLDREQNPHDYV